MTAALGELGQHKSMDVSARERAESFDSRALAEIRRLEHDYSVRNSRAVEMELLGTALISGVSTKLVESAAKNALETSGRDSIEYSLGESILHPEERRIRKVEEESAPISEVEPRRRRIRLLKEIVRREPRNALRWVDLSREYLILGQRRQSQHAMAVAMNIAPGNRFVLRSAARLLLQDEDFPRALGLLQGRPETYHDPWLLSVVVALSDLAQVKQRHLSKAHDLIASEQYSDWDLAELSCAVATVEIGAGDSRKARRHMLRALKRPTDNVLAQAQWSREDFGLDLVDGGVEPPRNFEAPARRAGGAGQWGEAVSFAELWLRDIPFSDDAAVFASWAAAQANRYALALEYAKLGITHKPDCATLLNNLAFCNVRLGNLNEAQTYLMRARQVEASKSERACLMATEGATLIAAGLHESGRKRYEDAISFYTRSGDRDNAAMAWLMLFESEHLAAREEARATWSEAEAAADRSDDVAVDHRRKLLHRALAAGGNVVTAATGIWTKARELLT